MTSQQRARLVHLPYLAACLVARNVQPEEAAYAGNGYKDTSRMAESEDPDVMAADMIANGDATADAIYDLINELDALHSALYERDQDYIQRMLSAAKQARDSII